MGIQTFPLKDGSDYVPPAALLEALESAYGFQNVYFQLPAAYAWLLANPRKRKTERGMPRFLNAWMSRAKLVKQEPGIYTGGSANSQACDRGHHENCFQDWCDCKCHKQQTLQSGLASEGLHQGVSRSPKGNQIGSQVTR